MTKKKTLNNYFFVFSISEAEYKETYENQDNLENGSFLCMELVTAPTIMAAADYYSTDSSPYNGEPMIGVIAKEDLSKIFWYRVEEEKTYKIRKI